MGINQNRIANGDLIQWHIYNTGLTFEVGNRWQAFGQRLKDSGGTANGIGLQCLAAREHQHHE